MGDEAPDAQMLDLWQHALEPSQLKRLMETFQPVSNKRPKGHGKGHKQKENQSDVHHLQKLVMAMSRLLIRHEDAINHQLAESQFLLHLQTGPGSILPLLLQKSQEWHQSDSRASPLRQVLVETFMKELMDRLTRVDAASDNSTVLTTLQNEMILNEERLMPYLFWDKKSQQLKPNKEAAVEPQKVKEILVQIQHLVATQGATMRFHALKRLDTALQTPDLDSVPFIWQVSQRINPELWNRLHGLCFHSSWRLIKCRLRPHSTARSNLAVTIQKMGKGE